MSQLAGDKTTSVHFIADDKGAFITKLGLVFDASALFGGPRSKRFAIIATGGKVENVIIEENPGALSATAAEAVLALL